MKKILSVVIIIVVLIVSVSAVVYAVSDSFLLGELFKDDSSAASKEIVASYNDHNITAAELEQEMKLNELLPGSEKKSELETLNSLILKLVLLDEAKELGLQASSDEISEFVSGQKQLYYDSPEIAATVDDYCEGAGVTLEEYWIDLEERAPRVIARNKVRNSFYADYLEKVGLEPGKFLTSEEQEKIEAAYEEYCDRLLEQNTDDIIYYKDVSSAVKTE